MKGMTCPAWPAPRPALPAAALLLMMAGCVQAPPRHPPAGVVTPPPVWTAIEGAPAGEPQTEWWQDFGDPHLDELIRRALDANLDLQAAAARLQRAEAEARIAGAELKPAIGSGLSTARQRQNFTGFPIPGAPGAVLSTTSTRYGVSVDTAWEIDLWGRLRAGARAALAEAQAAAEDLNGARLSLAGQTAKAWFALLEARQQVELARRGAGSFAASAAQVRARYRQGVRPAVELRLALSSQAGAEAELARRRRFMEPLSRQLEVLLGGYPAGDAEGVGGAAELPLLPPPVPAGLPAEILSRRPDLAAAERRLTAADQRSKVARRSLYPRLTLTGSGGTVSNELGDLVNGDFRVWSLVGQLVQPLFQGGRLRAGVERADALFDEGLALYAGAALRAYAEVETALASESLLAAEEVHRTEAAHQLEAARRLAEERYRSGVGDYLTVLESQTREFAAHSILLALRRQRLNNRVDLHLALGGGFDPPMQENLP